MTDTIRTVNAFIFIYVIGILTYSIRYFYKGNGIVFTNRFTGMASCT